LFNQTFVKDKPIIPWPRFRAGVLDKKANCLEAGGHSWLDCCKARVLALLIKLTLALIVYDTVSTGCKVSKMINI
jgi:hypothetical protein